MSAKIPTLVEENHDLPKVDFVITARTGCASDAPGREGALGLGLRTLRRGAAGRSADEIDETFDRLGAYFGSSLDVATVSVAGTVVRRNLEPFMDLVGELLLQPAFPPDAIAQVARETRAGIIDLRNDDRSLCSRHFYRSLFAGHAFSRPTNGTLGSLEQLTRDDAAAAYRATFTAPNLIIGAAGDITPSELDALVASRFGALPTHDPPEAPIAAPIQPRGRRLVIVDKPARTQTQIMIGSLGTHPFDPDHTALTVANTAFGGTFTARLMREVRSKRGWSYGASSRVGRERVRDAWYMWTFPAATDAAACVALQLGMLEELLAKGITERELALARSYLGRSFAFELETSRRRLSHRMDELTVPLPKHYYSRWVERVEAVTLKQANAALRKRLTAKDLVVTVVATADELRPALEKAIPGLVETRVVPFESDEIPQPFVDV